jgi:hypothetical protein
VLEILVLAMPHPPVFQGRISKANSGWLDTLASPDRPSATMAGAQPVFVVSVRRGESGKPSRLHDRRAMSTNKKTARRRFVFPVQIWERAQRPLPRQPPPGPT